MWCPNCRKELHDPELRTYCPDCGTRLEMNPPSPSKVGMPASIRIVAGESVTIQQPAPAPAAPAGPSQTVIVIVAALALVALVALAAIVVNPGRGAAPAAATPPPSAAGGGDVDATRRPTATDTPPAAESATRVPGQAPGAVAATVAPTKPPPPTDTATATEESAAGPAPTLPPTFTPSATPSLTPGETPTLTPSATPTETPTASPSATPTATPTATPSATPTVTPLPPGTPLPTAEPGTVRVLAEGHGLAPASQGTEGGRRNLAILAATIDAKRKLAAFAAGEQVEGVTVMQDGVIVTDLITITVESMIQGVTVYTTSYDDTTRAAVVVAGIDFTEPP